MQFVVFCTEMKGAGYRGPALMSGGGSVAFGSFASPYPESPLPPPTALHMSVD